MYGQSCRAVGRGGHHLHDPLPRTNWPRGGARHKVPPPRRLRPPPPHNPGPDTYTSQDEPNDPCLWGTWERKSLDTLLSIRSGNQGLGRAMYCLSKWTQRTWGIPTDRWLWKVTLRPQQREAPPNRREPTEGHVRGGGWLLVIGGGDIPRDVVPEIAQAGHPGDPCFPLPLFGVAGGGAGWGVGHVGLVVAGAALGVQPPGHGAFD